MKVIVTEWQLWAVASACFAALTALFSKVGVENIDSNYATLIRIALTLVLVDVIAVASGPIQPLSSISARTWIFLALAAAATGASRLFYYRAPKLGPTSGVAPLA